MMGCLLESLLIFLVSSIGMYRKIIMLIGNIIEM